MFGRIPRLVIDAFGGISSPTAVSKDVKSIHECLARTYRSASATLSKSAKKQKHCDKKVDVNS